MTFLAYSFHSATGPFLKARTAKQTCKSTSVEDLEYHSYPIPPPPPPPPPLPLLSGKSVKLATASKIGFETVIKWVKSFSASGISLVDPNLRKRVHLLLWDLKS